MNLALILAAVLLVAPADGWKAGTARVAITPREPMWMAGYGARNKPSEGAVHDLWAKALVLEDQAGRKAALITLDVCGIGRDLSLQIRKTLESRLGLTRDRVVLACSHTHCGPVVGSNLITMYPLDDTQKRKVEEYSTYLAGAIPGAVVEAAGRLEPVALGWETGRADFAVNRRANKETDVPKLRAQGALQGPVDHDVPVLRVSGADGKPRAIVCGYACHCTALGFYQFCGDYAGFAQIAVEKANPGAQAMFVAGCGADQNPLPRRTIELAEQYGNQLAAAVQRVLGGTLQPVDSNASLLSDYEEIDLPFGTMPTRAQVEADTKSTTFAVAGRARKLLATLDTQGSFSPTYPYPVAAWRLGDLTWIFLGGEVVVDYSLRLKRNLGSSHTWVSGYCNDVMAYIPSLRVLKEGGYEGATAMIYYGHPTAWGESVEEDIVASVIRLLGRLNERPGR
jgi:hypothetical protein